MYMMKNAEMKRREPAVNFILFLVLPEFPCTISNLLSYQVMINFYTSPSCKLAAVTVAVALALLIDLM